MFDWSETNKECKRLIQRQEAYRNMLRYMEDQIVKDGADILRFQAQCPHQEVQIGRCVCCQKSI